jgi:inner membrane protein
MDSLSQIALGAAVSVAVFRRKQPLWQSALLGAVAGTLPDLDVLISHGDPISDMTYHRTESHSLFYLTLFSPLLAWLWLRIQRQAVSFGRTLVAIWLVLITHPLLDMFTIYGTQFALPFSNYPFGIGSVFVIDPLYTLPLLIGTIVTLKRQRLGWNNLCLALSCAYLGFGLWAQHSVKTLAMTQLPSPPASRTDGQLLVSATPFNGVLWRLLWVQNDAYYEAYYSLLDNSTTLRWQAYPRDAELLSRYQSHAAVARLHWFSHGFVALRTETDANTPDASVASPQLPALILTDLRMGMEPGYSFSFRLPRNPQGTIAGLPEQLDMPQDARAFDWLYQRMLAKTDLSLAEFLQLNENLPLVQPTR